LTLDSIENQSIIPSKNRLIEVIVVDSSNNSSTRKIIYSKQYKFKIKYINQRKNTAGAARNIGASISSGEILFFIDADVILEKNFLNEHMMRHEYLENIALVSFKENITIFNNSILNTRPNIKKDFRFEKNVQQEWLKMHRHIRTIEVRKVNIMKETNNFKSFGKDRVVGVWDLPSMVVTNALSIKKKSFDLIGGFNLQFKGWGMEDTYLGACLIATDNYIIPCLSTGVFHIEHPPRSGSVKKKIIEFNSNVLLYLSLINRPIKEIIGYDN